VPAPRAKAALAAPPDDPEALGGFPPLHLEPSEPLWRAVKAGNGPWWCGSSEHGRFNLSEPEGTCYLARDEVTAVLEVVGPDRQGGLISREFIEERRLRKVAVPRPVELADLASRKAARFGVTLEIGTLVPYDLTRAWALRLRQTGVGGLRYLVRHDPSGRDGIALFGAAGGRTSWRRGRETPISDEVLEALAGETGVTVAPIPNANQLRVIS
jgi:hypothetical protein